MEGLPRGFKVNREGGERLVFSDAEFRVKVSAEATGGALSIIEEIAPLDTPLHVHANEDELFYVLEGEHVFRVREEEFTGIPEPSCSPRGRSLTPTAGSWPGRVGSSQ